MKRLFVLIFSVCLLSQPKLHAQEPRGDVGQGAGMGPQMPGSSGLGAMQSNQTDMLLPAPGQLDRRREDQRGNESLRPPKVDASAKRGKRVDVETTPAVNGQATLAEARPPDRVRR